MVFSITLADGRIVVIKASSLAAVRSKFPNARNIQDVSGTITPAGEANLPSLDLSGNLRVAGSGDITTVDQIFGTQGPTPTGGAAGALEGGQLPTPADLGPGALPVTPAVPGGQLELQSPFGAFTNFLGRFQGLGSGDPRSAARTFAESQFNPLRSAFGGQQLATGIDPSAEGFGNEFTQFLNQGGINPRQRLGEAFSALQGAAGGADPSGFLGRALNAQNVGESAEIFNLARNLQSSRISPLISSRFGQPSNEELFGRFAAGRQAGGGLNALDFARQSFGLGQLGF